MGIRSDEYEVEETFRRIIEDQCRRYPRLQLVDLYKLLYQASVGSEHAVSNEEAVRTWLERELATMGPGPSEPLVDPISPSGEIVRVHLRPYVEAGRDSEELLEAFLRTAREVQGSTDLLQQLGDVAVDMARMDLLPPELGSIGELLQRMERDGFPAAHHSSTFRRLYRPAYRVVACRFLDEELQTDGPHRSSGCDSWC